MNTVTHVVLGAALFTRPAQRRRNVAALAGGFLPDLYIFAVWGWTKLNGIAEADLWRRIYFQEPVQTLSAISNSMPLWALLLVFGMAFRLPWLAVLAGAALLHVTLDFPVHASDPHPHFWPLTDWRWHSPISYWEADKYAGWVLAVEVLIVLICAFILWRRFSAVWVRILVSLTVLGLAAPILYFSVMLGG